MRSRRAPSVVLTPSRRMMSFRRLFSFAVAEPSISTTTACRLSSVSALLFKSLHIAMIGERTVHLVQSFSFLSLSRIFRIAFAVRLPPVRSFAARHEIVYDEFIPINFQAMILPLISARKIQELRKGTVC